MPEEHELPSLQNQFNIGHPRALGQARQYLGEYNHNDRNHVDQNPNNNTIINRNYICEEGKPCVYLAIVAATFVFVLVGAVLGTTLGLLCGRDNDCGSPNL